MADCSDVTFEKELFPSDGDLRRTMDELISQNSRYGHSPVGAVKSAFMYFITVYDTDSLSWEHKEILLSYYEIMRDGLLRPNTVSRYVQTGDLLIDAAKQWRRYG